MAKATLTVAADDQSRVYGDANPTLTATFSGFKNGENLATSGVTGSPDLFASADPTSPVNFSPYSISASTGTLASGNYDFSFADGNLSITPATLIVAADPQTRLYGEANPTLTYGIGGFKNGENLATSGVTGAPDVSTLATPTTPVSILGYGIQVGLGTLSAGNYDFVTIDSSLLINKAHLRVTALDATRVYGSPNPQLNDSITGFVNGETLPTSGVTGQPVISTAATPTSPVSGSPYAITASAGTLAASNYDFSFVAGDLSLTKAPLTITAADQAKLFGQAVPTLTASYSGFVNGETPAALTTLPTLSTTATANSPVANSPYAITASGAASGNYAFQYVDGKLSVSPSGTAISVLAPTTAVFGQTLVLSALVSPVAPGAGSPTGTVTFFDGATSLGSAALNAASASILVNGLAPGPHAITAVYAGDGNFAGGTSTSSGLSVVQAVTTLGLTVPPSVVSGQAVTLVASLNSIAAGSVRFTDGGTPIGTATIVNGVAVLTTTLDTVGTHVIRASYAGGGDATAATSPLANVSVGLASPQVVLTVSPFPAANGQVVTLSATVAAASPSGANPAGIVSFFDNGQKLGDAWIIGGRAVVQIPASMAGTPQTITATYGGDDHFASGTSNPASETVIASATSSTLTITPLGAKNRKTQLDVTVSPVAPGGGVPNGVITFVFNGKRFRTQALSHGHASITIPSRNALNKGFRADFSASSGYLASQSNVAYISKSTLHINNWGARIQAMRARK